MPANVEWQCLTFICGIVKPFLHLPVPGVIYAILIDPCLEKREALVAPEAEGVPDLVHAERIKFLGTLGPPSRVEAGIEAEGDFLIILIRVHELEGDEQTVVNSVNIPLRW
jgi:hypothetical protein